MKNMKNLSHPVARIVLGLVVLWAAFSKLMAPAGVAAMLAPFGLPAEAVWAVIGLELACGAAILTGLYVRIGAGVMAAIMAGSTGLVLAGNGFDFAAPVVTTAMTLIAGLLMLSAHGAGGLAFSLQMPVRSAKRAPAA